MAALDAVDGALAGAEHLGELLLRPAAVLAGVADQVADAAQVVLSHAAGLYLRYEISPRLTGCVSCASRPSTAPATSASRTAPAPTIEAPTDAILEVTAGCICGSDLWPYRGENPINAGQHDRPRDDRRRRRGGPRGDLVRARRLRDRPVLPQRQHLRPLPGRDDLGVRQRRRDHRRAGRDRQGHPGRGQPVASSTRQPDALCCRRCSRCPTSFPTGWHCAVAAGVEPGDTVVVVGDGAVGLCARARGRPAGRRARGRDVAARPAPGDRPPLRGDARDRRARRGGRRPGARADRRHRRGRRARVRGHRRLHEPGLRLRPGRARRSASSACRTASSCRCAGCSARTSGSPAASPPYAATCPS